MIKKILLLIFFIVLLLPLYFMFIGSFMDIYGTMKMPPVLFPINPTIKNYIHVLSWPILLWSINTIIIVLSTVFISVLISTCTGYVFSFYHFRFKNIFWSLLLVGMMIPRISLIIPTFVIMRKLGLNRSLFAAVLPIVLSPVGLYLARNYFDTIPRSLIESARIDGASDFIILSNVIIPISKPIITALSLFAAIFALQDFIWQMLVLMKDEYRTLLVGIIAEVNRRGGGELNVNPVGKGFAASIILMVPLVLIFLVANKYFISSLEGAIKE